MVLPFRRMCGIVTLPAALLVRLRGPMLHCAVAISLRIWCSRCCAARLRTGWLEFVASHHMRGGRRRQAASLPALRAAAGPHL